MRRIGDGSRLKQNVPTANTYESNIVSLEAIPMILMTLRGGILVTFQLLVSMTV